MISALFKGECGAGKEEEKPETSSLARARNSHEKAYVSAVLL